MRVAIGLIAALCLPSAFAQVCAPLAEYDEILSVTTENFFDRSFNGLDWPSRVSEYRHRVTCDDDPDHLAIAVNQLFAELNASHTALYTRNDQQYWGLLSFFSRAGAGEQADLFQISYSGIWAEQYRGEWFARLVMQESPAARVGVLPGDRVVTIDGVKFSPLGFPPGKSRLVVSSDGRSTRSVRLTTVTESVMVGFENASRASTRILKAGGKSVGYFQLWAGGATIRRFMEEALSYFESKHVDALIMDLRGGYGGMGEDHLNRLRQSEDLSHIPKYFLVDDTLRSGKELVAGVIKRDQLGVLVGSRTAGQYLGGRTFLLAGDKYLLYVAVGGSRPPRDIPGIGPIEGQGIQPDVLVEPCWRYCGGRDPILQRALELIAG